MNLKEYVDALKEVLEQNPEYSKLSVVTASDEEGNSYNEVYYLPTLGNFSISNGFVPEDNYEDLDEDERITNSVCLN